MKLIKISLAVICFIAVGCDKRKREAGDAVWIGGKKCEQREDFKYKTGDIVIIKGTGQEAQISLRWGNTCYLPYQVLWIDKDGKPHKLAVNEESLEPKH